MGTRRQGAEPSSGRRLAGVEGLRAIAAGAVLLHHIRWVHGTDGAAVALPAPLPRILFDLQWGLVLFFVLSGFLLFRPFAAAILRGTPAPSTRDYLRNRVLRIVPAYWVILLLTGLVFGAAVVQWPTDIGRLADPGVLLKDMLLVQGFTPETVLTGIGPAWSLAVEAVFYLLLPLLAAAATVFLVRRGPRIRHRVLAACLPALALVAVGVVGKLVHQLALPETGGLAAVFKISFPVYADLFAPGMLAAVLHVLVADGHVRFGPARRRAVAAAAAATGLIAVVAVGAAGPTRGEFTDTLFAAACGLAVLALIAGDAPRRSPAMRVLESRPMIAMGLASYSVYLWHTPVIFFLTQNGLRADSVAEFAAALALVAAVTGVLSWATYRWVEAPVMARKRSTRRVRAGHPTRTGTRRLTPSRYG